MWVAPASAAAPGGTVAELLEPGYLLHDRVLRPALASCEIVDRYIIHHSIERTIKWCAIIYNEPLNGAPLYIAHH